MPDSALHALLKKPQFCLQQTAEDAEAEDIRQAKRQVAREKAKAKKQVTKESSTAGAERPLAERASASPGAERPAGAAGAAVHATS